MPSTGAGKSPDAESSDEEESTDVDALVDPASTILPWPDAVPSSPAEAEPQTVKLMREEARRIESTGLGTAELSSGSSADADDDEHTIRRGRNETREPPGDDADAVKLDRSDGYDDDPATYPRRLRSELESKTRKVDAARSSQGAVRPVFEGPETQPRPTPVEGPPPMRPQLDSGLGQWLPWEESSDAASASSSLTPPIRSDTEQMARFPLQDVDTALRSQIEANLAESERASALRHVTRHLDTRPLTATGPMRVASAEPEVAGREVPGGDRGSVGGQRAPTAKRSARPWARSPVSVFFVTFVLVAGFLGTLVAVQHCGARSGAPAPSAPTSEVASRPSPEAASAPPSASAAAPALSVGAPRGKPSSAPTSHVPRQQSPKHF